MIKREKYIRGIICLMILTNVLIVGGQNTTSRLTINSGSHIDFYVNTFDKYQNGITYNNWTTASVYFIDTTDAGVQTGLTWKLDVRALNTGISGTLGTLPLNTIELVATSGGGPIANYSPVFALSDTDNSLVTNGTQTDILTPVLTTVLITYHCGKSLTVPDNSLLGSIPDYYAVDIVLTLGPE